MNIHIDLIISGKVQGVGYRAAARRKALQLGLRGYVQNEWDGTVTVAIEGPEDKIQEYIAWCHEGSMLAKVDQVTSKRGDLLYFSTFEIRK